MPVNVSEELVNITKNVTGFQPDDVTYTMLILESIVQMVIYLDEVSVHNLNYYLLVEVRDGTAQGWQP